MEVHQEPDLRVRHNQEQTLSLSKHVNDHETMATEPREEKHQNKETRLSEKHHFWRGKSNFSLQGVRVSVASREGECF